MITPIIKNEIKFYEYPNRTGENCDVACSDSKNMTQLKALRHKILCSMILNFLNNSEDFKIYNHGDVSAASNENIVKPPCSSDINNFSANSENFKNYHLILLEYLKGIEPELDVTSTSNQTENSDTIPGCDKNSFIDDSQDISSQFYHTTNGFVDSHSAEREKWRTLIFDEFAMKTPSLGQKPLSNYRIFGPSFNTKLLNIFEDHPLVHVSLDTKPPAQKSKQGFRTDLHHDYEHINYPPLEKLKKLNKEIIQDSLPEASLKSPENEEIKISKPRRRYRTATNTINDTNSLVSLPISSNLSSKIEQVKYSEIVTPFWLEYRPSENAFIQNQVDEDLSEEAYLNRHASFEMEEHNKYLVALQMGNRFKKRQSKSSKTSAQKLVCYDESNVANNITLYNEDTVSRLFS